MCTYSLQVVQEALDKANLTEKDLTAVAVTIGPGLSLCLRSKFSFSLCFSSLSFFWFVLIFPSGGLIIFFLSFSSPPRTN